MLERGAQVRMTFIGLGAHALFNEFDLFLNR
jgi:hypothetical protein